MTGIQWKLIYYVFYNNILFKNVLNLLYFLPIIRTGTVEKFKDQTSQSLKLL